MWTTRLPLLFEPASRMPRCCRISGTLPWSSGEFESFAVFVLSLLSSLLHLESYSGFFDLFWFHIHTWDSRARPSSLSSEVSTLSRTWGRTAFGLQLPARRMPVRPIYLFGLFNTFAMRFATLIGSGIIPFRLVILRTSRTCSLVRPMPSAETSLCSVR